VFFQGHPEYDTISLLKEFKREVLRYIDGEIGAFPPFPENYFGRFEQAVLKVAAHLNNSWCDTADAVVGNWMGLFYQLTHKDRDKPFMDHIDPEDPLGLNARS